MGGRELAHSNVHPESTTTNHMRACFREDLNSQILFSWLFPYYANLIKSKPWRYGLMVEFLSSGQRSWVLSLASHTALASLASTVSKLPLRTSLSIHQQTQLSFSESLPDLVRCLFPCLPCFSNSPSDLRQSLETRKAGSELGSQTIGRCYSDTCSRLASCISESIKVRMSLPTTRSLNRWESSIARLLIGCFQVNTGPRFVFALSTPSPGHPAQLVQGA